MLNKSLFILALFLLLAPLTLHAWSEGMVPDTQQNDQATNPSQAQNPKSAGSDSQGSPGQPFSATATILNSALNNAAAVAKQKEGWEDGKGGYIVGCTAMTSGTSGPGLCDELRTERQEKAAQRAVNEENGVGDPIIGNPNTNRYNAWVSYCNEDANSPECQRFLNSGKTPDSDLQDTEKADLNQTDKAWDAQFQAAEPGYNENNLHTYNVPQISPPKYHPVHVGSDWGHRVSDSVTSSESSVSNQPGPSAPALPPCDAGVHSGPCQ